MVFNKPFHRRADDAAHGVALFLGNFLQQIAVIVTDRADRING
jgi:hypothetical protein